MKLNSLRKLYFNRNIYDHTNTDPIFIKAVRNNVCFHIRNNPRYRKILESRKFFPKELETIEDLCKLPFIPTIFFKNHRMWTLEEKKVLIKATSSGTKGKKSIIGFDSKSLFYGLAIGIRMGRFHKLFSIVPTNYLLMGYKPHKSNQTVFVKTQGASTWFAPALHREYAFTYRSGQYHTDFVTLKQALKRYAAMPFPVRLIGFPSYTYFFLEDLKREGQTYRLPKGSMVLLGGGWKQFYREKTEKQKLYRLVEEVLGIGEDHCREFFGAVEHPAMYCDCKNHHFHVPVYSRVIIREVNTLEPVGFGKPGLVNLITPIAESMPLVGVSVIQNRNPRLEVSLMFGNCWVKPLLRTQIMKVLRSNSGYLQTVALLCGEEEWEALSSMFCRAGAVTISKSMDQSSRIGYHAHDGEYPLRRYSKVVER